MTAAKAARPLLQLAAAACLATTAATAIAQDTAPDPAATPQPAATVRDPDFGVAARHFGLERQVEMFQWRSRGDGGYERAWSGDALDSTGFAPGHDNPPFPLRSRRWVAASVSVDGAPLDPAVLSSLGRWLPFRPSFNALPGNLAATFQPQGDGLGTAENPVAPQVGDLRIHWRELRLPPLGDRIELRTGRWVLRAGAVPSPAPANSTPAATDDPQDGDWHRWLVAGLLLAAAASVVLAQRRGRAKRGRGDRA